MRGGSVRADVSCRGDSRGDPKPCFQPLRWKVIRQNKQEREKMEKIVIKKETTIQSYEEFWGAFLFLKKLIDQNVMDWRLKLSALIMACFAIEAFANHVGKNLFPSWNTIERGVSPIGKLKMFIEMKKMGIRYEEAP
jgi:hypothetical protein